MMETYISLIKPPPRVVLLGDGACIGQPASRSPSSFPWLCLLFDTSKGLLLTSCHPAGRPSCGAQAGPEEKAGDLAIAAVPWATSPPPGAEGLLV